MIVWGCALLGTALVFTLAKDLDEVVKWASILGAWDRPIDKKLSMPRPCATLGGDPLRS
jgi:hypothetical protein